MPAKSKKQANFMNAVAHSKEFSKQVGIPQKVAKEMTKKVGGRKVPGLMKMDMKARMAKLRSMRTKKTKSIRKGGQFGEIAIPAAAIALGSAAPAVLGAAYEGGKNLWHYLFDKKTTSIPLEPTRALYTNASFRGNGVRRPNLMTPRKRGGMMTPVVSGPLA